MVYCGRPSKGCENCREKRLKCDQKRPSCGQCRNKGRDCLGYRDEIDLAFRNENDRIITKYRHRTNPRNPNKDPATPQQDRYTWLQCPGTLELTQVHPAITEPIQDVAVVFLLNEYTRGSQFGYYLPDLYSKCEATSVLSSTMKAVGLASLSLYKTQPELRDIALRFYAEAITEVNHALQSQEAARGDDVLASIMLLSLYEALTLRRPTNTEAWSTHVHGAMSLVALRGREQLQSKIGLELFRQTTNGIKLFCIQHRTRIPDQLRQMLALVVSDTDSADVAFVRPSATEAFSDLRADVAEGVVSEPDDIVARCEVVLQLVEDSLLSRSPSQEYDKVMDFKPSVAGHRRFHLNFKDHLIAQTWNTGWMAKMALNFMIYEQELRISKQPDLSTQIRKYHGDESVRTLRVREETTELAEHICATIPENFHWIPQHASVSKGYSLIWPLFAAGANPLVATSIKDYIISQLEYIATEFKLPQAQWARDMLVAGTSSETWMHMYHIF